MTVQVEKDGEFYTMCYDPCHYDELVKYYEEEYQKGAIDSYIITK
jgi:hypothetical protein